MAGQSRSRPFSRKISKQPGGEPAGATSRRPAIAAPRTVGAGPPARKWGQWARWPVLAGSPGRERGPDKRLAIFLSRTVGRQGREVGSATGRAHIPHQARYSPRVSRRLAALQQASSRGCALPVLTVPPGLRAAARPRSGFCRVTKSCGCCIGGVACTQYMGLPKMQPRKIAEHKIPPIIILNHIHICCNRLYLYCTYSV